MTVTLKNLRDRALDMCDIPSTSAWVDTTMMTNEANNAMGELRDVISENSDDFLFSTSAITVVKGVSTVPLPADFLSLRSAWIVYSNQRRKLSQMTGGDIDNTVYDNTLTTIPYRYKLLASQIKIWPYPMAAMQLEIEYDATFVDLAVDGDALSVLVPKGWENFIVYHLCAYLRTKAELDPGEFLMRKDQLKEVIAKSLSRRDSKEPKHGTDLRNRFRYTNRYWWPDPTAMK